MSLVPASMREGAVVEEHCRRVGDSTTKGDRSSLFMLSGTVVSAPIRPLRRAADSGRKSGPEGDHAGNK